MSARQAVADRRAAGRRRLGLLIILVVLVVGAASGALSSHRGQAPAEGSSSPPAGVRPSATPPKPPKPLARPLVVSSPAHSTASWTVVARVHGRSAAWLGQRSGVTLMRFDQALIHVDLHAGSSDGGTAGWRYGDQLNPQEIHKVIAAINGGFKLTYSNVGFLSDGHVAVALKSGLASIVTYTDGTTNIGAWRAGVPSAGKTVFSVLQNQQLLVDRGAPAASVSGCVLAL